ncbi:MAG: transposase [Fibrobacterota bacterium]
MTTARSEIVTEGAIGIYHCVSRCVHRAFLCGNDPYTGKYFEHRKTWVQARLELLARTFALEICAFTVMENHVHVVLRTRPDLAGNWSDEETAARWLMVFPKRKTPDGRPAEPSPGEIKSLADQIEVIRGRLSSLSWFMRSLTENIARRANREDNCKGRFWEGRFKCQVILDESAFLTCLTYVDLNLVRAGAAVSPETSPYTSAFLRIQARQARARMAMTEPAEIECISSKEPGGLENEIYWSGAD